MSSGSQLDFKYITEDIFKLVEELNKLNLKVDKDTLNLTNQLSELRVQHSMTHKLVS